MGGKHVKVVEIVPGLGENRGQESSKVSEPTGRQ
jgi:hypothetical protein